MISANYLFYAVTVFIFLIFTYAVTVSKISEYLVMQLQFFFAGINSAQVFFGRLSAACFNCTGSSASREWQCTLCARPGIERHPPRVSITREVVPRVSGSATLSARPGFERYPPRASSFKCTGSRASREWQCTLCARPGIDCFPPRASSAQEVVPRVSGSAVCARPGIERHPPRVSIIWEVVARGSGSAHGAQDLVLIVFTRVLPVHGKVVCVATDLDATRALLPSGGRPKAAGAHQPEGMSAAAKKL